MSGYEQAEAAALSWRPCNATAVYVYSLSIYLYDLQAKLIVEAFVDSSYIAREICIYYSRYVVSINLIKSEAKFRLGYK